MLSDKYKLETIPEKFNRSIQTKHFPSGYEELYLSFYDFDLVKDLVDYWGLLYCQPSKEIEVRYIETFKSRWPSGESAFHIPKMNLKTHQLHYINFFEDKTFKDDKHFQNTINKAVRQEARQAFFDELDGRPLKKMSQNVRWVAEMLVMTGYAQLVL